ncbi:hypothetical protein B566_EDAN018329 [Ephemera danica]|nr:hypothetical protein B566_EDAN018329 [Ephemera danica]
MSGAVSMARIAATYSGIKDETNLDELEEMLSRDELINDHLISYCYNAKSVLYYIREIRPVFIHVHSVKKTNDIQVEASNSITSVPCQFCGINLKSLYNHLLHLIKAHHACKKCMITHRNAKELLDHFKRHQNAEILLHYCKHCGLTFPDVIKYEKHCKSNHGFVMRGLKPISARIGELECPYCFSSFYKEVDLILHLLKYHKKMKIEYKDGKNKTLLTLARYGNYDSDNTWEPYSAMDSYNIKVINGGVKLAQLEEALFGDPIEDQLIQYCYNRYADVYYFRTKNIKFMYLYSLNVTQGVLIEPCVRITSIPCRFCTNSFPTLRDHVTHIMKEHFACKTCQLEHHDVKSLIAHLKLHELGLLCVFTCRPCCSLFDHMDDFCRHLMEKHQRRPGKDYNTRLDHREFIGSQILSAKIGTMECPYCPCNFADELILIRHVIEEHKVENFTFKLLDDDEIDWQIPETMNQPLTKPVEDSENAMIVENDLPEEKSDIIAMAVENADIATTMENSDMATEMSNLIAMAVENFDTNAMAMEHSDTNAMIVENQMAVENIQDLVPAQTFQPPIVANQETVQTTNENLTDSDEDLASRLKRSKKEVTLKKKRTNWRNQSLFLADLPQMPKMNDLLAMLRMGEPVAPLVAEYFFNVPSHNMFFRQKHAIFINVRKLADRINWLKVEESVRITCMPCQHCNSSFDNLVDYCSHLISSHYMCKMCELPHHDMEALIEHTRLHERGNIVIYYCRLVSKIFRSFEEHKKHVRNCTTSRRHHRVCFRRPVSVKIGVLECPYCPINYTKEMDLIQHIVVDHRIPKFEYQLLDTDEPVEFEIPPIEDETEQAVESVVMEVQFQPDVTESMDSFEAPHVPDWSESEDLIQPAIASPEPEEKAEICHLLVGVLDKLIRADELGHPVGKLLLEYCIQLPASSNCISPSLYLHIKGAQMDLVKPESPTRITTIPCLYCAMISNSLKSHFQHLISDHFFCKLCQIPHDNCMSLLVHLKLHESENINMYVCKRSFVITNSFDVWRDHLEICTDELNHCEFTNLSMKLGTLECPYCPFNFTKQIELVQHVYFTHKVEGLDYEKPLCHVKVLNDQCFIYQMGETKITSGESPKILKNIPCKYCDIKSATLELHEKHLKEVHHLCKPCKKLHTDICALKLHYIEHELKKIIVYVCKECPALLSNINECKSHVKIHKGSLEKIKNISCTIGSLECPYCSLNFFAEIELVKHLVKGHKHD